MQLTLFILKAKLLNLAQSLGRIQKSALKNMIKKKKRNMNKIRKKYY